MSNKQRVAQPRYRKQWPPVINRSPGSTGYEQGERGEPRGCEAVSARPSNQQDGRSPAAAAAAVSGKERGRRGALRRHCLLHAAPGQSGLEWRPGALPEQRGEPGFSGQRG